MTEHHSYCSLAHATMNREIHHDNIRVFDKRYMIAREKPSGEAVAMFRFSMVTHYKLKERGDRPNIIKYSFGPLTKAQMETYQAVGSLSLEHQRKFYDDEWQIQ
jgi:hypothetical protein